MMTNITITIPDEIAKKLLDEQNAIVRTTGKNLSVSELICDCLKECFK